MKLDDKTLDRIAHLIALLRARDLSFTDEQTMWAEVVALLKPWALWRLASATKDLEDGESAFDDAIAKASGDLSAIDQDRAFPGWILTTAVRMVGKERRARCKDALAHRAEPRSTDDRAGGAEWAFEQATHPYAVEEQVEVRAMLREIRDVVTKEQLEVLLLTAQGYAQEDIAEIVGVPVTTVKMRVHHGRKALKLWKATCWGRR